MALIGFMGKSSVHLRVYYWNPGPTAPTQLTAGQVRRSHKRTREVPVENKATQELRVNQPQRGIKCSNLEGLWVPGLPARWHISGISRREEQARAQMMEEAGGEEEYRM